MTALREREIARRLAAGPALKPPADLLGRLQADIPENLELHPELQSGQPRRIEPRFYWLSAASLAVALTGGIIALQTMKEPMITDREGIRAGSREESTVQARQEAEATAPLELRAEAAAQEEQEFDGQPAQGDSTGQRGRGKRKAADLAQTGLPEASSPPVAGESGSMRAVDSQVTRASEGQPEPVLAQGEGQATADRRRGEGQAVGSASKSGPPSLRKELPSAGVGRQKTAARAQAVPEEGPPSAAVEAHEVAEREADQPLREIPIPKSSPSAPAPQIAPPQAATAPSVADAGSDLTLSVPSLPPGGLSGPPAAARSKPAAKKLSEPDSSASARVAEPDAPARFAAAGPAPGEEKAGSAAAQEALLQGTVVAEDGSPLAGVTVTVMQRGGVIHHAVTDEHGGFLLPSLPLGYAEIRFGLAGSKVVVLPVTLAAGRQDLDRITLLPATVPE